MAGRPTYEELEQKVQQIEKEAVECQGELEATAAELSLGLSEILEALRQIASGDPEVRIPEIIRLAIRDNGRGFDIWDVLTAEVAEKGFGMTSMKERAELSGGTFTIESSPGEGTVVEASWPY